MLRPLTFIVVGCTVVLTVVGATYIELSRFHPEAELRRMRQAMAQVETARVAAGMYWIDPAQQRRTTSVQMVGQVRLSDTDGIEYETLFHALRYDPSGSYEDVSGSLRRLAGQTYLQYTPPGPQIPGVSFIPDTWISFSPNEFAAWGDVLPGIVFPLSASEGTWSPAAIARARAFLPYADVWHVSYDGEEEDVRGVETRVLNAWFDADAVQALALEEIRLREDRDPTMQERVAAQIRASAFERLTFRVWIGKADHRLYRLQATGSVPSTIVSQLIPVDILVDLSDMNAAFAGTVPSPTIVFRSLVGSALAGIEGQVITTPTRERPLVSSTSSLPSTDLHTAEDMDGDGLDTLLERFYGTNANNADTDGDGVSDGAEVAAGRNPNGRGGLFSFGLGN